MTKLLRYMLVTGMMMVLILCMAYIAHAQDQVIRVKDLPVDFPREYRMHVGINGIVLEVDAHWDNIWEKREYFAYLRQPDDALVSFDIKHPADKILDRDLFPIVQAACRKILAMDRKFLADGPKAVDDRFGHSWTRIR